MAAFWPQAPALWFAQAECTLAVKRAVAQFDRYCHGVAALPHESIRLVADIVEGRCGKAAPRLPVPEASKEARLAAGLCIKHWIYGEAASSCEQPCSWQGNGGAGGN